MQNTPRSIRYLTLKVHYNTHKNLPVLVFLPSYLLSSTISCNICIFVNSVASNIIILFKPKFYKWFLPFEYFRQQICEKFLINFPTACYKSHPSPLLYLINVLIV
jgi:hypothetical protein